MIRYKDLTVICKNESQANVLFIKIKEQCNTTPFVYDEKIDKMYSQDEGIIRIHASVNSMPDTLLILSKNKAEIKVINIIPYKKSTIRLTKEEYNNILDEFYEKIISKMCAEFDVLYPEGEYTMESLIPDSYNKLVKWVNNSATQEPFIHSNDLHRWFDFVIDLIKNKEFDSLSSSDLESWLEEEKHWNEDVIEETILHYEHDIELLQYYGNKY